jgi:hypothetical protein
MVAALSLQARQVPVGLVEESAHARVALSFLEVGRIDHGDDLLLLEGISPPGGLPV